MHIRITETYIPPQFDYSIHSLKSASAPQTRPADPHLRHMAPASLQVMAWFSRGSYYLREEYVLYGSDSLIADVGGYLGLLLGHSLLSLFYRARQCSGLDEN